MFSFRSEALAFLAVLAAGIVFLSCIPGHPGGSRISVMSFNVRYDNPGDGENAWPQRKERVAATIRFHEADIAGLQEVLHHQLTDLAGRLPEYAWLGAGRDDGREAGEYAPIFYKRDRFRVLDRGHFWLSQTPDLPGSMGWDAACTRIVTWAQFQDRSSGGSFYFLNTHFDHVGETARIESAKLLLKFINGKTGEQPVILCGDFNSLRSDSGYVVLAQPENGLAEASTLCGTPRYGSTYTFNGFDPEIRPGHQIDFIFVRNVTGVDRYGVISDRWDGKFVSDHHAVLAGVEF
ncbi:endonuclease/exonuclease/phosphatase family protein [bacterium]|nr:endonuclease/exonuclease/phosphatase family protein [bacterium]